MAPVETAFRWTAAAVSAIAIVAGSGGTALPAAGAVSSALLIGDTGYSAVTGNTLISGTQLSPEERNWAIAETGATLLSLGANKWLAPLSQMKDSTKLGKVASIVGKSDDAVDGVHVVYDVLTKGEEEGASSFVQFALFKGVGLAAGQFHKSRTPELPSSKVGDVDVRYQEYVSSRKASGQEPLSMLEWKTKVRTLEQNKQLGAEFKAAQTENFKEVAQHVENNITIATTIDGQVQKVKVSAIGVDADGKIRIQDYTTKDHISTSRQAILDNISKNGGVIVGKGKGEFVGGIEVPKGTRVDVVTSRSQKIENFKLEMKQLPRVDLSTKVQDGLISTENGRRLSPKQYMSQEEIDTHLNMFKDGVVKILSKDSFDYSMANFGGNIGPEKGHYVLPKFVYEKAVLASDGNPRVLEELLALDPGYLGDSPISIEVANPQNLRIPTGNEPGAWQGLWEPGGYTQGGLPEAVADQFKFGEYTVKKVYE